MRSFGMTRMPTVGERVGGRPRSQPAERTLRSGPPASSVREDVSAGGDTEKQQSAVERGGARAADDDAQAANAHARGAHQRGVPGVVQSHKRAICQYLHGDDYTAAITTAAIPVRSSHMNLAKCSTKHCRAVVRTISSHTA